MTAATDDAGSGAGPPFVAMCHLDLDCFYAQVEMLRVGAPRDRPFVVSQWGNLIAVNYPARAHGIGRFDSVDTARAKCPELRWEHVATYAPATDSWAYHPEAAVRKATHKVSLEPYRIASRAIFAVLNSFDGVAVEKGGIDEAFLDVTAAARARLEGAARTTTDELEAEAQKLTAFLDASSERMQDPDSLRHAPIEPDSDDTRRLFYAACLVVDDIRAELRRKTGYEASAGIAKTRSLAKVISATHKPNRQTLLLPGASKTFLFKLPFTKLRGFGGKLGSAIASRFAVETCGELWAIDPAGLAICTGGDMAEAKEIAARIRGCGHDTDLTERNAPKSLLAQKAFAPATRDDNTMLGWLRVLSRELVQRMVVVFAEHGVRPHNFNLKVGSRGLSSQDLLNKSQELPWPPDAEALAQAALALVRHALLNHETPGVLVDCFLLGATVLRPDPLTSVVDGAFVVKQRQASLQEMLLRRGRNAAVKRERPTPEGRPVPSASSSSRGGARHDDVVLELLESSSSDDDAVDTTADHDGCAALATDLPPTIAAAVPPPAPVATKRPSVTALLATAAANKARQRKQPPPRDAPIEVLSSSDSDVA